MAENSGIRYIIDLFQFKLISYMLSQAGGLDEVMKLSKETMAKLL